VRHREASKTTLIPSSLWGAAMPPTFFHAGGNSLRPRELYIRDVTPTIQKATDGRPEVPGLEAGLSVCA